MSNVPFWPTLWPGLIGGLAATLIGGAILLLVGYWLVDRRLHLRDRAARNREDAERTERLRNAALRVTRDELQSIAAHIDIFADAIAADNVPYPPFDTNGWTLLSQANVFATLQPETAQAATFAYNRVRSANRLIDEFADLTTGATAAMVHAAVASGAPSASGRDDLPLLLAQAYNQYQSRRADLRTGLAGRLRDLRENLDIAIDAVEVELGEALAVPSAHRSYLAPPVSDLTQGREPTS